MAELPPRDAAGRAPGQPRRIRCQHRGSTGRGDAGYSTWAEDGFSGWAWFTGGLMGLVGLFQVIAGITALASADYYTVPARDLVIDVGYSTWGWVHLVLGLVMVVTGGGLAFGNVAARVVGVALAGCQRPREPGLHHRVAVRGDADHRPGRVPHLRHHGARRRAEAGALTPGARRRPHRRAVRAPVRVTRRRASPPRRRCSAAALDVQAELAVDHVDGDLLAGRQLAVEQQPGQPVVHLALDRPAQRPGAELRLVARARRASRPPPG